MSFLSGIGNIFHSIGHFFEGGDDENQPQQNNRPTLVQPTQPPAALFRPQPQQAQPSTPAQQPAPNGVNLYQPPQKANQVLDAPVNANSGAQHFDVQSLTNGTLAKAQPTQPTQAPSGLDRAISTGADIVARTAVGVPQGISQLVDQVTPGKGTSRITKNLNQAAQEVDQDQAKNGVNATVRVDGEPVNLGDAIYKGGQIGLNVGTGLEGGIDAATKLPGLVKAAPDIIKGIPEAVQGAGDAVDNLLTKVHPANLLNKANTATDIATPLNEADKAAGEVAVGLKSANPNQVDDAVEQVTAKNAQAAANAQPIAPGDTTPPPSGPATEQPAPASNPSGTQTLQPTEPPVQPVTATPQSQTLPENPSLQAPSPSNVAQSAPQVNTAPNAPNVQAGFSKELGTDTSGTHEVMQKEAMQQRALQSAQSADLPTAIAQHSAQAPNIQTPQDAFDASALMRRMYAEAKTDPASVKARNNLAEAIADYGSRAGQGTNVMADMTANLPPDAKANVIQKTLVKIWGDKFETKAPAELKTLSGQSRVQSALTDFIEQGEDLKNQMAALQGKLNAIAEKGAASAPEDVAEAHSAGAQLKTLELQSQIKNAEAVKYYDSLVPRAANTERAAQAARTAMLSAPSGRLNNAINVVGNSGYELLRAQIQAAIGKAVNAVAPGKNALDTGLVNSRTLSGAVSGAKTSVAEAKNGRLVDDLGSTIWNKSGGDLARANDVLGTSRGASGGGVMRKAGNLVKAAVTAPRNIFGGALKDSALLRLSRQEGMALGKTGDELDAYAAARSYVPSDSVWQKAQDLQDQVSHTNKNAFTGQVEKWFNTSKLSGTQKGIAANIKNAILPFAKFPTTMLYNVVTDRNILADVGHFAVSVKRGDVDGITKALAGAVIDGGGGALGWHLANMGLITNKDANGYDDNGLYLHLGSRFVPLDDIGVGAESMIGGASMALATAQKGGNVLEHYVSGVANTLLNTFKGVGGASLVGAGNQSLAAVQNLVEGKPGATMPDTAATVIGQGVGQFVPAATGDINAVLNHSPLDPTGEAALTKVTKGAGGQLTKGGAPSTAKDVIPSTVNTLINRVPVASQLALPRNPAVNAPDILDRVTRGSSVGAPQKAATAAQATATQSLADDIKNGVPVYKAPAGTKFPAGYNFDNTLKSAQENGNYDLAIKGLQNKLKALTTPGPEHNPPSAIKAVKDQVTQMQVLKDGKYTPDDMAQYHSVSNSEWRKMGDPTSDAYDPKTYQKLYALDQSLAGKGIADGTLEKAGSKSTGKFYLAANGSGSRSGAAKAAALVKDNTIGSLPSLARENFMTNLSAKPITARVPQIKLTSPESLIKKRSISVASPRGNYN